jgi:flagellar biosynthesis/type III secretory pathway chaperone
MDSLLLELATVLQREIDQYRRLHTLLRRERGRIVKGEWGTLTEMVQAKETVVEELAQLASSRRALLERVAVRVDEPAAGLTLARLVQVAPADARPAFSRLLEEFRGVVGRLVAANEVNRMLVDRSIEFVQGSLSLFRTIVSQSSTYGADGRLEAAAPALRGVNQTV